MKNEIKIALVSVFATLAVAGLLFVVLNKVGLIEINPTKEANNIEVSDNKSEVGNDTILTDGKQISGTLVEEKSDKADQSESSDTTCIKHYSYEDVSFNAPCDWVLDLENSTKNDIRLNKGDYILRFHGYFGVTGGGFGHFFDGICAVKEVEYTNISQSYYRYDEYVNYSEVDDCDCIKFSDQNNGVDNCNWVLGDQDLWFGTYLVKENQNNSSFIKDGQMDIGAISYFDLFPETDTNVNPLYYSVELINTNITKREASGVLRGDAQLTENLSVFNDVVESITFNEETF